VHEDLEADAKVRNLRNCTLTFEGQVRFVEKHLWKHNCGKTGFIYRMLSGMGLAGLVPIATYLISPFARRALYFEKPRDESTVVDITRLPYPQEPLPSFRQEPATVAMHGFGSVDGRSAGYSGGSVNKRGASEVKALEVNCSI
jgi:hypothetical protein